MFQNTKSVLCGIGLLALPLLFTGGCGGGNGLAVSPTATATPTVFPGSIATSTPIPTAIPAQAAAYIAASISNSTASVPNTFRSTLGSGGINNLDAPSASGLGLYFFRGGKLSYQSIGFGVGRAGKIKTGDVIQLAKYSPEGVYGGGVSYSDIPKNQYFLSKSGTLKIDSLTTVPASGNLTATKITFTLSNVVMAPSITEPNNTATGNFTINATGTATLLD